MDKEKKDFHIYILSKCWFRLIIGYYVAIILAGIFVSILVMANLSGFVSDNILLYTNFTSMAVSGMLCSVQYLRRLYKACLNNRLIFFHSNEDLQQSGNILYFILRPVFAIIFVIIMEFALLSGVIIVSADFQINERFLYFCVILSGFIGFSIGRILDRFEELSSKHVNKIFENQEEN